MHTILQQEQTLPGSFCPLGGAPLDRLKIPPEEADLPGPSTNKPDANSCSVSLKQIHTENIAINSNGLDTLGPLMDSFWEMDREQGDIYDQARLDNEVELKEITQYIISFALNNAISD